MTSGHALVFGASGVIGRAIADALVDGDVAVTGVGRHAPKDGPAPAFRTLQIDPVDAPDGLEALTASAPYDRVIWAQGMNANDSLYTFDREAFTRVLGANVLYVAETLSYLLKNGLLAKGARLCVVSSIWQTAARQDKFSYSVSKAALQGLVLSAATDLARDGHVINAILPGVLDTQMTRAMLSPAQIAKVEDKTLFKRLPYLEDVVSAALFLCSPDNRSMTGQFVAVDLGFRHAHIL